MSYYTKNFFVGELDWTNAVSYNSCPRLATSRTPSLTLTHPPSTQNGGTAPSDFYALLETFPSAGSMIWSVFGHDGNCCNYVSHVSAHAFLLVRCLPLTPSTR